METLVARSMAEERFRALLATIFGAAALVLAAVGLYGLAARRVADRRREIAVRVALGARPVDVRRLIVSDALRTIALGLLVGLPAAFAASQVTQTLLFGVTPTAPRVFATAAAVLALAAVLATILPARRAAAIDPMVVLKE
jgi:putative ABC transport system permease protein